MVRTWKMLVWNGKKYVNPTSDGLCKADGPLNAVKMFGLNDPMYTINYSRKGYGHYTGRVDVRAPETVAAGGSLPIHADFVLLAVD